MWDLANLADLPVLSTMVNKTILPALFYYRFNNTLLWKELKFPPYSYGFVITNVIAFTGEI